MRIATSRPPTRRRQRGAALLTAMIIVTLVATLAAAMVWQQWRAVQVESAERARVQAAWILSGALDFALLILREDQKTHAGYTALTEPWATPLEESRLSTFLAVDKSNADDGPEAFLSGNITDAQSRYNLRNLVALNQKTGQLEVVATELATLGKLCETANIETGVAQRIAAGMRDAVAADSPPGGTTSATSTAAAPLLPRSIEQLTWLGVDAGSILALRPYIVLLPEVTALNVNTASREVLAAVVDRLDVSSAERLVQVRQRTPFKNLEEFRKQAGLAADTLPTHIDVKSSYFEVRARLRLIDRVLVERSLVQRSPNGPTSKVLQRERIAHLEPAGK